MLNYPQCLLLIETFYVLTMIALKFSLGLFFLRIFIAHWMRRTVQAVLVICLVGGIAYLFTIISQCGFPISQPTFWEKNLSNHCQTNEFTLAAGYSFNLLMAITDLVYVILPVIVAAKTVCKRREKVLIASILLIGAM